MLHFYQQLVIAFFVNSLSLFKMLEVLLSIGFVVFGTWKMFDRNPTYVGHPYLNDLRCSVLFSNSRYYARVTQVSLIMSIIICPSSKAMISAVTLLLSMFLDELTYPPEELTSNREENLYRIDRTFVLNAITGILLIRFIYPTPVEITTFVFFKIISGSCVFWFGYCGKIDFDEYFCFPNGYSEPMRSIRRGAPDLELLQHITCPDIRYRIFQWIGFSILADERLVYCFVYCNVCFLIQDASARHRDRITANRDDVRNPLY